MLVLNYDDPRVRPLARKHQGRTFFVSAHQGVDRGAWLENGVAWVNVEGTAERIGVVSTAFAENLLSSLVVARLSGIDPESLVGAASGLFAETNPA